MSDNRDPAANQLQDWKAKQKAPDILLNSWGSPRGNKDTTLTAGPRGIVLLQDTYYLDEMSHFTRERIAERVVHAKGAGAFGYFELTKDLSEYTAAKIFTQVGKKTSIAVRFSQVAGESGSADTVRDIRGFALKFYTDEGVWDLVGNNTPIFFIRDPTLFPSFVHSQKRNPVTHLLDYDAMWDFMSLRPETTHQFVFQFGDRGIPASYRHMNGYGSHTFKFVNATTKTTWCKFHYKTDLGIKNIDQNKAEMLAGSDPDYYIRDLYNAIANGNFPSWTFYVQIMTEEQAEKCLFNPFDVTKVWPYADYPLIQVGKFILNQNPSNYFAEVEQIAFDPANSVPGIKPSPDKMLQGRLFAYGDAQRYRLGVNNIQIPVNRPFGLTVPKNYQRDGRAAIDNQSGAPNYHPNSFCGPEADPRIGKLREKIPLSGNANRYDLGNDDNYTQARVLYQKVFDDAARERFIKNVASSLKNASSFIQERVINVFSNVDQNLAERLSEELKKQTMEMEKLTIEKLTI